MTDDENEMEEQQKDLEAVAGVDRSDTVSHAEVVGERREYESPEVSESGPLDPLQLLGFLGAVAEGASLPSSVFRDLATISTTHALILAYPPVGRNAKETKAKMEGLETAAGKIVSRMMNAREVIIAAEEKAREGEE